MFEFPFRVLRANRSDAATLMNLSLALIVSEVVFGCGMHRTDNVMLCKGVAITLHYFLLCALVWLGCGGIVLIRVLKKKNRTTREYDPVLKYYLVGWGTFLSYDCLSASSCSLTNCEFRKM